MPYNCSYPPGAFSDFDRRADARGPQALEGLMEAAGTAAAETAAEYHDATRPVMILAGKGNNGGDALVAARILSAQREVHLCLPYEETSLNRLALLNYRRLPENIIRHQTEELEAALQLMRRRGGFLLDGLLGTGFHGTLAPELAAICAAVNRSGIPVIAIDCPSGLNCADGTAEGCIRADVTVALCGVKSGMLADSAVPFCGKILVRHLPGDDEIFTQPGIHTLFDEADARELLPQVPFDAHKFSRGSVAVIGGSASYPHAPVLSAAAALYSGAGMVFLSLPGNVRPCCAIPAALVLRALGTRDVHTAEDLTAVDALLTRSSALAVGPGMDRNPESIPLLRHLIASGKPLVLDADALALLASNPEILTAFNRGQVLLTPHEGEAARLLAAVGASPASRAERASVLASAFGAAVLLKGPRTIVAAPDGRVSYNMSGCSALATAGSGDVLTGIAAAMLAAGMNAFDAGRLAAWLHGASGEAMSHPSGRFGIIADDLPKAAADVLKRLR